MTTTRLFEIALAAGAAAALAGRWAPLASGSAQAKGAGSEGVDVAAYGARGDGTFDNSTAFAAVSDAVNRMPLPAGGRATVLFPPGRYRYSAGLAFAVPVTLVGPGAILEYAGQGVAVRVRAGGAAHVDCAIEGLTFAGAAPAIAVDKDAASSVEDR